MAKSFAELKKKRRNISDLQDAASKAGAPKTYTEDERFWAPTDDKNGNGSAVIRFLPPSKGEDVEWVTLYRHAFKGPTGLWYIQNCLTSLGKEDPCCELNNQLWNSGVEADKKVASSQKRKLTYVSNIYVISDPKHPENEGRVFLYRYGQTIFDMIKGALKPEFEDEEIKSFNPFDFYEGASLKLRFKKEKGYRTYSPSTWASPGPLMEDEDELEKIWESQYPLQPEVAPTNFKEYDELKKQLERVLLGSHKKTTIEDDEDEDENTPEKRISTKPTRPKKAIVEDDDDDDDGVAEELEVPKPAGRKKPAPAVEDDDEDYFKKMMEDDD